MLHGITLPAKIQTCAVSLQLCLRVFSFINILRLVEYQLKGLLEFLLSAAKLLLMYNFKPLWLWNQVNNGVDHVTSAAAAGDVSNDVDDDASSKRSDANIWDYRVTITVSVVVETIDYLFDIQLQETNRNVNVNHIAELVSLLLMWYCCLM